MKEKYFSGLNYTLGNEDTSVEIELSKIHRPKDVFSVCGSGGRSLPLCASYTEHLTLSDLSSEQIKLAMLREATYRQLAQDEFLLFWGYYPYSDDNFCKARKELFLKLDLPNDVRGFFTDVYSELEFTSVLYLGKWERTFQVLAKITRTLMGKDFDRILRFDDLALQRKYYETEFPHAKWKAVIFLLGNKTLFNALLYKGSFIEKNVADSHFEYYLKAFDRLFRNGLAQKSFFLHLCFYGKINSLAGVPVEASAETHERVAASNTQVQYVTKDLIEYLKSGERQYDFLSLSDVPSYFKGDLEANFMQIIRPSLRPGAIVINRYYLRVANCRLEGFTDITREYEELIKSELVQMYDIRVYKYTP